MTMILVTGNPHDGFKHIGPFTDGEATARLGEQSGDDWWVVPLEAPPTDDYAAKVTVYEVMSAINDIRKLTSPPSEGEVKQIGIDQIIEADNRLIALHDRLLNDYGDGQQHEQGFEKRDG